MIAVLVSVGATVLQLLAHMSLVCVIRCTTAFKVPTHPSRCIKLSARQLISLAGFSLLVMSVQLVDTVLQVQNSLNHAQPDNIMMK